MSSPSRSSPRMGAFLHLSAIDTAALHRVAADEDVLRDREMGQQQQFLMDHADAGVDRLRGVAGA